jgi:hypothetical protein
MPRLDYSGSCPALLLEPQRTNVATHSEYFGSWIGSNRLSTPNEIASPEGISNGTKLAASGGTAYYAYQLYSTSGANVFSVFLKYGTKTIQSIYAYSSGSYFAQATFNLSTGVVDNVSNGTASIEDYGNGWYRCSVQGNAAASLIEVGIEGIGASDYTYAYGAQLEAGSYPTSYIPTYGSSVTRSLDSCEKTGIGSLFGTTGSTIYFETTYYPETNNGQGERWVYAQGNSSSDYIRLWQDVTGGIKKIRALVGAGGVQQVNITTNATSLGLSNTEPSVIKYAFAFAENDFRMYVNGIVRTDNFGTIPTLTEIKFNSAFQTLFPLKQALVFPTALTDSECIALTTL